jgi:hypothetical protein
MIVDGFRNFDEARQYSRMLLQQESIKQASQKARPIVISHPNLVLINSRYSYNDYDSFYVANFAPLPPVNAEKLYEPLPVEVKEDKSEKAPADEREAERRAMREQADPVKPILPTEDVAPGLALPVEQKKEEETGDDGNTIIPSVTEITVPAETAAPVTPTTEITVPTETAPVAPAKTEELEIAVPVETAPVAPAKTEELEIAVPVETAPTTPATQDEFIIEDSRTTTKSAEDTETIEIDDTPTETPVQEVEEFIIEEDNDKKKKSTRDLEDEYFELDGF